MRQERKVIEVREKRKVIGVREERKVIEVREERKVIGVRQERKVIEVREEMKGHRGEGGKKGVMEVRNRRAYRSLPGTYKQCKFSDGGRQNGKVRVRGDNKTLEGTEVVGSERSE